MMKRGRIPAKANIRRIWLFGFYLIMLGLCGSNAFALDMMGPPTAELETGSFRAGIEYSESSMDLNLIEGKATIYRDGLLLGSGTVPSLTIKDYKVDTLYAAVGYGIFENCEVFLRMGMANATFGDSLWNENEDFDSKNNFAIGAGAKATFYEGFDWKIGGIFQINQSELDGKVDSSSWGITQPHFAEISTTEMQIALGATYMWTGRVTIYGGPFVHFISGDFDYEFSRITGNNFDTGKYSWSINEGPTYGGYIGSKIKLARESSINLEYQQSSEASVFGASLGLKF
jgi:hypothetical protein